MNSCNELNEQPSSENDVSEYFDRHGIFLKTEDVLRSLARIQPEDPNAYLSKFFADSGVSGPHRTHSFAVSSMITAEIDHIPTTFSIGMDSCFPLQDPEEEPVGLVDLEFTQYLTNLASAVRRETT